MGAYYDGFDLPDGSELSEDTTKDEYFERMFDIFLERFEEGTWMYSDDDHGIMMQAWRVLYVPVGTPVNVDSLGHWENRYGDQYGVYGDKITSWLWKQEIYAGAIFGHEGIDHMEGEEGKDFDRIVLTAWIPWEAVDWASTIAYNISIFWQENELCVRDKEPVYELNYDRNSVVEASLDKAMNAETFETMCRQCKIGNYESCLYGETFDTGGFWLSNCVPDHSMDAEKYYEEDPERYYSSQFEPYDSFPTKDSAEQLYIKTKDFINTWSEGWDDYRTANQENGGYFTSLNAVKKDANKEAKYYARKGYFPFYQSEDSSGINFTCQKSEDGKRTYNRAFNTYSEPLKDYTERVEIKYELIEKRNKRLKITLTKAIITKPNPTLIFHHLDPKLEFSKVVLSDNQCLCFITGLPNPSGYFESVDNICEHCQSKWIYDEGGSEGEGYYRVKDKNLEVRAEASDSYDNLAHQEDMALEAYEEYVQELAPATDSPPMSFEDWYEQTMAIYDTPEYDKYLEQQYLQMQENEEELERQLKTLEADWRDLPRDSAGRWTRMAMTSFEQ